MVGSEEQSAVAEVLGARRPPAAIFAWIYIINALEGDCVVALDLIIMV
jgi:hypothetical protein